MTLSFRPDDSGQHPIYVRLGWGNSRTMREKTGNGHQVDVEQFLEDIKTVVRDGQELLRAGMSTVKERMLAQAQSTRQVASEKPYAALGIAFTVGLVAGLVLSGSFSRHEETIED